MYYLSVLAIFKNETMTMKTWLDHYIWQGVEHFFLIDNGSTDNPINILKDYIDKGFVTYVYYPERYKQTTHYRNIYNSKKINTKTFWLIVCDLDEFFYGLDKMLRIQIRTLEPHCDYIICNWWMFGSDNCIQHPVDIRLSNTHREPFLHTLTKYIFKTNRIQGSKLNIHTLTNVPNEYRICRENHYIRLNHYPIQSLEYFKKVKMTRGDATEIKFDKIRTMDYFTKYNINTTQLDETLHNLVLNPPDNYSSIS